MRTLNVGQCATLACLLEAAAPKPGNVHRGADFADMTLQDFLVSGVAIGPVMQQAAQSQVGRVVLNAIQATQEVTRANTNLGIALLFAPIACVPHEMPVESGITPVLAKMNSVDAADVYQAIQLAAPGGLQPQHVQIEAYDVAAGPAVGDRSSSSSPHETPTDLLVAMRLAAAWDSIALQYVTDFELVLKSVVPWLLERPEDPLTDRIVRTHVRLMSEHPDSLIARKCGIETAREAASYAAATLRAGGPQDANYHDALADLDFWLRSDGNRRNPGTTADLIAAGLFAALRDGRLSPPYN